MNKIERKLLFIGLGKMGSKYVQHLEHKGYELYVFDKNPNAMSTLINECKSPFIHPLSSSLETFLETTASPDIIVFLMLPSGKATESTLKILANHLSKEAIIVDLSNSRWEDSNDRCSRFKKLGIHFFAAGFSGGPEGALHGGSIMIGGTSRKVYEDFLEVLLTSIVAEYKEDRNFIRKCIVYFGSMGAGSAAKEIHNLAEYGIAQLIYELFYILYRTGYSIEEIRSIFIEWNRGEMGSFLLEKAIELLGKRSKSGNKYFIDSIEDVIDSLGTGIWSTINALETGEPIPVLASAVWFRSMTKKRIHVINRFQKKPKPDVPQIDKKIFPELLKKVGISVSYICYVQAIDLLIRICSKQLLTFGEVDIEGLLKAWRGGCVIRSNILITLASELKYNKKKGILNNIKIVYDKVMQGYNDIKTLSSFCSNLDIPLMLIDTTKNYLLLWMVNPIYASFIQGLRHLFGGHPVNEF